MSTNFQISITQDEETLPSKLFRVLTARNGLYEGNWHELADMLNIETSKTSFRGRFGRYKAHLQQFGIFFAFLDFGEFVIVTNDEIRLHALLTQYRRQRKKDEI